ncbi:MAG: sulfotransferase domain-containing protein, partial [Bacteroidia bacterium]
MPDVNSNTPNHRLISLMIIGAQKAGTTSIKEYLGEHPSLQTHLQKEFSYFFDDNDYAEGYEKALKKYFPHAGQHELLIAKNAGLYTSEDGIRRLKEHNPNCEIVILLRNPVERTYSAFLMEKNYGHINIPFQEMRGIIEKADTTDWRYSFLIGMSLYAEHLEMIYRHFPKEKVTIIRYEELNTEPVKVCAQLFAKLGVDSSFVPNTKVRHNVTHKTRSQKAGKFITRLLRKDSRIKEFIRGFMPGRSDYKAGELLRKAN